MAQFKARARAVDMLGRQQISGRPTAISLKMPTMPMRTRLLWISFGLTDFLCCGMMD
jgi:hypothetical protein